MWLWRVWCALRTAQVCINWYNLNVRYPVFYTLGFKTAWLVLIGKTPGGKG